MYTSAAENGSDSNEENVTIGNAAAVDDFASKRHLPPGLAVSHGSSDAAAAEQSAPADPATFDAGRGATDPSSSGVAAKDGNTEKEGEGKLGNFWDKVLGSESRIRAEATWNRALDAKDPTVEMFKPSLSDVLDNMSPGVQFFLKCRKYKRNGVVPFIDPFVAMGRPTISADRGVPCGGMGSGSIGRGYKGGFTRYCLRPGLFTVDGLPSFGSASTLLPKMSSEANGFSVRVNQKSKATCAKILQKGRVSTMTTNPSNDDDDTGGSIGHSHSKNFKTSHSKDKPSWADARYYGRFPRAWTEYRNYGGSDIHLLCKQTSPFFPGNYDESCLPVVVFEWHIHREKGENAEEDATAPSSEVSIMFSWTNQGEVHLGEAPAPVSRRKRRLAAVRGGLMDTAAIGSVHRPFHTGDARGVLIESQMETWRPKCPAKPNRDKESPPSSRRTSHSGGGAEVSDDRDYHHSAIGSDRLPEFDPLTFGVAVQEEKEVEISMVDMFFPTDKKLWNEFALCGTLRDFQDNDDDDELAKVKAIQWPKIAAAAVCGRVCIRKGEYRVMRFTLSWDMPVARFPLGHPWLRKYSDTIDRWLQDPLFFSRTCSNRTDGSEPPSPISQEQNDNEDDATARMAAGGNVAEKENLGGATQPMGKAETGAASEVRQPQPVEEGAGNMSAPMPQLGWDGGAANRRYRLWSRTPAALLCANALAKLRSWDQQIEDWQSQVMDDPGLPDWYKGHIFNELYFLVEGGTLWSTFHPWHQLLDIRSWWAEYIALSMGKGDIPAERKTVRSFGTRTFTNSFANWRKDPSTSRRSSIEAKPRRRWLFFGGGESAGSIEMKKTESVLVAEPEVQRVKAESHFVSSERKRSSVDDSMVPQPRGIGMKVSMASTRRRLSSRLSSSFQSGRRLCADGTPVHHNIAKYQLKWLNVDWIEAERLQLEWWAALQKLKVEITEKFILEYWWREPSANRSRNLWTRFYNPTTVPSSGAAAVGIDSAAASSELALEHARADSAPLFTAREVAKNGDNNDTGAYRLGVMKKYGHFLFLESMEYLMYNTYDVYFYASWALMMLFPKLDLAMQLNYAECVERELLIRRSFVNQKVPNAPHTAPRSALGCVPHDVGGPGESPLVDINVYAVHNTDEWKDLPSKFILQVYRHYALTKDTMFMLSCFPAVELCLSKLLRFVDAQLGLVTHQGWPDHTYDVWTCKGVTAYSGGLYLAAVSAYVAMARAVKEYEVTEALNTAERQNANLSPSSADLYKSHRRARAGSTSVVLPTVQILEGLIQKGVSSFEQKLWNEDEGFFSYDSVGAKSVHSDQLAGVWYLRACGLDDILPREHISRALKAIYEYNVKGFHGGEWGAVNGVRCSSPPKIDNTCVQSRESWTGVTYAVAAELLQEGMTEEAFKTAQGVFKSCWQELGLWYQTPEAIDTHGRFRAHLYMRPLSIWAIQYEWQRKQAVNPHAERRES